MSAALAILAAGEARRAGLDKVTADLGGIPLLLWSLAAGEAAKAPVPPLTDVPPPPAAPAAKPAAPAASPLGGLPVLVAGAGIALGAIGAFVTSALSQLFSATATVSAGIGDIAGSTLQAMAAASGPPDSGFVGGATAASASVIAAVSYPFALLLVIAGVVLVPFLIYAIPVSLATWFRLRRRDLATLLEASGWAINTRLYLDRSLAVRLTRFPKY